MSTQDLFYPVAGDRWMLELTLVCGNLLENSICAYIEWLVNELMMTANKIEYKDAHLVMLLQMQ